MRLLPGNNPNQGSRAAAATSAPNFSLFALNRDSPVSIASPSPVAVHRQPSQGDQQLYRKTQIVRKNIITSDDESTPNKSGEWLQPHDAKTSAVRKHTLLEAKSNKKPGVKSAVINRVLNLVDDDDSDDESDDGGIEGFDALQRRREESNMNARANRANNRALGINISISIAIDLVNLIFV